MIAHLVHAHSEEDSFVAAMKVTIVEELIAAGARVTVSDLYATQFNPVISPGDFQSRKSAEHLVYTLEQRHAYETGTLALDIKAEIERLVEADLVIFTFPVFWFSVPAILKGWIDRVFISGLFYGGKRIYGRGGMAGKKAFAAMSLGGREHMFGPGSLHGELATGMMRHFFQGTLGYVGFSVYQPFVAYHVPYLAADARERLLSELRQAVKYLPDRSLIAMPDLKNFDERFAPLTS